MIVDRIVKNAKVFTSAAKEFHATAFAVKDGKFVYVGDEAGLKDYEGEVVDLGGKFVMPAFIDSHVHIPGCTSLLALRSMDYVFGTNKQETLQAVKEVIDAHPDYERYTMVMSLSSLGGEVLTKEDLDAICPDKELVIAEAEMHSSWSNSMVLKYRGVTDDTPDMAEGLSYYVRDENGHITGNCFEGPHFCIALMHTDEIPSEAIESEFERWVEFCKSMGVTAVFEAGTPGSATFTERGLEILCDMDRKGKLPVYIDGSYMVFDPAQAPNAIQEVIRQNKKFNTEHVKLNTLKILLDGTLNIRTANVVEPYLDTQTRGGRLFNEEQIADFLRELNKLGFNLHVHCVADGSVKTVLDAVEIVKKELGDEFRVKVTIAHIELMRDEDISRFKELGVFANFTPWWHSGCCMSGGHEQAVKFLGERANKMYRCKSVWDTGATVTWSCDTTQFGEFLPWNPMLGFEVGITKEMTPETKIKDVEIFEKYPSATEAMNVEEMILGYTINGAKQLGIDDRKGSIEAGKDADYVVFDEDLFNVNPSGFSHISPKEVWFAGEQVNNR